MMDTEQLIDQMSKEAGKAKPGISPRGLFARWLGGSLAVVLVALGVMGLRPDLSAKLMQPMFMAEIVLLGIMMLSMAFTASCLAFPDMHQKRWALKLPVVSSVLFMVTLVLAYLEQNIAVPLPPHNMECLICIVAISFVPGAWMFALLRRQASTHLSMAGSTTFVAAMSIGALTLRLSEDTDSVVHLLTWHYLPMTLFALLGAWLGQKCLKW